MEQRQDQSALRRRMDVDILPTHQDIVCRGFVRCNSDVFREMVGLNDYSRFADFSVSILGSLCCAKYDRDALDGYNYLCIEP